MIDAALTVLAVADGDHSTKPRIALVRRLEPGRWPHIAFVEGYPLASGQTLTAIWRVPEDAMRLITDENTVIGAHGCANIHATDSVGAEGNPVAAARQHFAPEAWTFEAATLHHKGQTSAEGSRDHLAEFQIDAEIAQMLDRQRIDQCPVEQRFPLVCCESSC